MPNCPPRRVQKQRCKNLSKCNGVYSPLDTKLVTGKVKNSSSLLYSRHPYECPPTTTCLASCITELPNIPKEKYTIYSSPFPGNMAYDYSLMPNVFSNQCPLNKLCSSK